MKKRVRISSIVENQLPEYVQSEFPFAQEFLKQYYISLFSTNQPLDISQNIDNFIKLDNLTHLIESTTLTADVSYTDRTIRVTNSAGFPDRYGLIKIDDEIIGYEYKDDTNFYNCHRSFSGIIDYVSGELIFEDSQLNKHSKNYIDENGNTQETVVANLSISLLKQFLIKIKTQVSPGFEQRQLYDPLNENIFIKQSSDFYKSKGTEESFRILFNALYGNVDDKVNNPSKFYQVLIPSKYLIEPSSAQYRITQDLIVESVEGDPLQLLNKTLIQPETDFTEYAQGTVTKVEKITRDNKNISKVSYEFDEIPSTNSAFYFLKEYYIVSLDYEYNRDIFTKGSTRGIFTINSKTKIIGDVSINQEYVDVDSTIGFPESGLLLVDLENGTSLEISYTSKSSNQFFGCSGITQNIRSGEEIKTTEYAYGNSASGDQIKVRITGVVENYNIIGDNILHKNNSNVIVKTLGDDLTGPIVNSWLLNVPNWYDIKQIELNTSSNTYSITTYDPHKFNIQDSVYLTTTSGIVETIDQNIIITSINSEIEFTIQSDVPIDVNRTYRTYKKLSKLNHQDYPELNYYNSNITNIYSNSNDYVYITAPSFPKYRDPLKTTDRKAISTSIGTTSISFNSPHGFYSGEKVVIKDSENASKYFIGFASPDENDPERSLRISPTSIGILNDSYVNLESIGFTTYSQIQVEYLTNNVLDNNNLTSKKIEPQKLIKKIQPPVDSKTSNETISGPIGIFVNGVELLNYKSNDYINYGEIVDISVINSGRDYDIINPPVLQITDSVGIGASGRVSVKGSLERIDILDPGHNYLEIPKIEINGGNGKNAKAVANLVSYTHKASFNAQNISSNEITFIDDHRFSNNDSVIFIPNSLSTSIGLSTNSTYFVSVTGKKTLKLHNSFSDSSNNLNAVSLSSGASAICELQSVNKKRRLGSIKVISSGENYTNRKYIISSSGINTSSNSIEIKNHKFNNKEIVEYHSTIAPISGLTSSTNYYVKKIDDDSFRLFELGTSEITTDFYYNTNQHINLVDFGEGDHIFKYPDIEVTITGKTGIVTSIGQSSSDFSAEIQPIFRGEIESVILDNNGDNYGNSEVLNINRLPLIELSSGKNSEIEVIANNGKIESAFIKNIGQDYNSPPTIKIVGDGSGAQISPIIDDSGRLIDLYISSKGDGYTQEKTSAIVVSSGTGANLLPSIKKWTVNNVERLILDRKVTDDDGYLTPGLNRFGLQYFHLYPPRELRKILPTKTPGVTDLVFTSTEELSSIHSPIIGWSYDGNPIYGPYGFRNVDGTGGIVPIKSGYEAILQDGRPNTNDLGFFVEDYIFTNNGDLDEHNGRFCVTPEFPNGTYAYFCTIDQNDKVSLQKYFRPVFPYVIGNTYKSSPIEFNFNSLNNQNIIDLNTLGVYRNSFAYNIENSKSGYDFFLNYDDTVNLNINSVKSGNINFIKVIDGGEDYQVNDRLIFDNLDTNGSGLKARVSFVDGVDVNDISFASSITQNVELIRHNNSYIGFSTLPHNLYENDIVTIISPYENAQVKNIDLRKNELRLRTGLSTVSSTGIVTYIDVYGDLSFPTICENDIYVLNNERLKIIEIDQNSSRVRVIRNWDETTSGITSHSAGIGITEDTRKIYTNLGISSSYNYEITREYYFNPSETIGIGTLNTTGVTTTLSISNPGIGNTTITLPLKAIFLKSHNLNTGSSLIYKSNGGDSISVSTDAVTSFELEDNSIVYVNKISNNLIGLSTVKLGIDSTGNYSGIGTIQNELLYFTGIGTGSYHSLTYIPENNLVSEIQKNFVTVSVAQTHRLSLRDNIKLDVKSGLTTTCTIKYNSYNRRLVANSKSIVSVDTVKNVLLVENHNFVTGQKVIFNQTTPIGGLNDNSIYYISVYDSDRVKLCLTNYDISIKKYINLTSSGTGELSPINPNIICYKNQILNIDLSDSSLSYRDSTGQLFPAFLFNFYTDESFATQYDTFENTIIEKSGVIGEDAIVKLKISDKTPEKLYYNLIPVKKIENPSENLELIVDDGQISNNKISVSNSKYSGTFSVYDIDEYSFKFNIVDTPEINQYTSNTSDISYSTNSTNNYGPISEIEIIDKGNNYQYLPKVSSINSINGKSAILELETDNIGTIESVKIKNYGFDYSADLTLEPKIIYPTILKVSTLYSIDSIGVTSVGFGYNISPTLLVFDGITGELVQDVSLDYDIVNQKVNIIENTSGISKIPPQIIPINNSNGIGITESYFDPISKIVTLTLSPEFSDPEDFPFTVGGKVLIEGMNVDVGTSTTIKGYNSENYGFSLFTIVSLDGNIGGAGATISYSMEDYLEDGDIPGEYNTFISNGVVIPEKFFPTFEVKLKDTEFFEGEIVKSKNSSGKVEYWDSNNSYLAVSSKDTFEVGDLISGQASKTKSTIDEIFKTYGFCDVKAFSIVDRGWNTEKGFLNNEYQRIHDSEYYQYFSYSIKSEVSIDTWNDPVSNLNHTAGFKKFSDLVIRREQNIGFRTDQNEGAFTAVANLFSDIDLECKNYFDYAYENYELFGKNNGSNQIIFKNNIIQDYIEAKSNRVLPIDDISNQFTSTDSLTPNEYSNIYSFELNLNSTPRHIKNFVNIKNKNFINESEFCIVSVIHTNTDFYLNTYGEIFSTINVGEFDLYLNRRTDVASLRFYPTSPYYNDYDINLISFELNDYTAGIGSTSLGDIVKIDSHNTTISSGTSTETNIVSISSTYRSAKVSVLVGSIEENLYEYSEFNILNSGADLFVEKYGNLETDTTSVHSGLGTFAANIIGNEIVLKFTPNNTLNSDYYANSYFIGIGSTSSIVSGQSNIGNSVLKSSYVSISSSPTPVSVGIASNTDSYQSSYYILSIEDTTNNQYQFTELITHYNKDSNYINWAQYGDTVSNDSLGIITCGIIDSEKSIVYFTPNENIDCQIRIFEIDINEFNIDSQISPDNSNIKEYTSEYFRNQFDVVKSFELKHNNYNIFQRTINPQESGVINIDSDIINIENHFFSTGEEIVYEFDVEPIGIATTVVPGIGSTDKLPSSLYVIKDSDNRIRVSASSTECLASNASYFDLISVGSGSTHTFTSKKQNTKCLITIDNMIQSPVVSTSKTTVLSEDLTPFVNELYIENPNNIGSGDFLRINDEILKVNAVGVGSTNKIIVDRSIFGTDIFSHSQNDLITKLDGNYNIIGNTLYFSEPPYGFVPIEDPDDPYEIDYQGLQFSSQFSGRVFLRSGVPDTDIDAYENNYIFDSLTEDFNGVDNSFELTQNGESIIGFSTNNSVVLVRSIFQEPERLGGAVQIEGAYGIGENSGITSITFNGNSIISSSDINSVNIPRGGVIISVASTSGFGYQPLVAAEGTALVSAAGTIQSVSIGNSGSGYRVGIQTVVNVGIQTRAIGVPRIEFIGTATISNGNIVGVSITNPGVGYTSYYEVFTTNVSSTVSSGSTIIPLDSIIGITSLNYISISDKMHNVKVVGVGTTSIFIGSGSTISAEILIDEEVTIKDYDLPEVIFDDPLSYTNIPLIYSSSSISGIGTLASANLIVSQDSSIISFELNNSGYGYEPGDILTIPIDGLVGIPTDISKPFEEFQITIERIYNDNFFGWTMGTLQVLDPIDDLIDGTRKIFPLRINKEQISIEKQPTSSIDLQSTLIIFVDDVLQIPGESYVFDGGSIFYFIQPPNPGSKTKIMFYRGTDGVDTYQVDIEETVKIGDNLRLTGPSYYYDEERTLYTPQGDENFLSENSRIVEEIISSKIARTNIYSGVGINSDSLLLRNVRWCKQRNDLFVNGLKVSKSRLSYEPSIYPITNIIQNVGINTTEIFVENLKTFFDSYDEYFLLPNDAKVIDIISQDEISSGIASVVVSTDGTIQDIILIDGGNGYTNIPQVSIGNPLGVGVTVGLGTTATAIASITSGIVTTITIINPGFGYTNSTNVPIIIEPPEPKIERIRNVSYEGDFGIITGIASTSVVGVAETGLWVDLYIPKDSFIRDSDINAIGIATTGISGIKTGYYFSLYQSGNGDGTISYRNDGSIIGIGTTYMDNVYQVLDYNIEEQNVIGIGLTYVNRVLVSVDSNVGIDTTNFYGNYSWGRISFSGRNSNEFEWYNQNGIGINTSPLVRRVKPLKYKDYTN